MISLTKSQQEVINNYVERISYNEDNFCTNNYGSLQWQELGYQVTFSPHTTQQTLNNLIEFALNTINDERESSKV